jgi:hypothetical protein
MATKLKAESKCDEKISQKTNCQILVILREKNRNISEFHFQKKTLICI